VALVVIAVGALAYGPVSARLQRGVATAPIVFVRFDDAARIDLRQLRREHDRPVRMPAIGMPPTAARWPARCSTR